MPVTRYVSANGRLRGEITAGSRTDYLTDALGSVTATVNSSAAVVNTYRFKSYGQQLAKTGSGADPRYLWTGDTGSRRTTLNRAEQYNVFRHYGSQQAAWTTVDPLWPDEPAYCYGAASPATYFDPNGGRALLACIPCAACLIALGANCYGEPDFFQCVEDILNNSGLVGEACRTACDACLTRGRGRPGTRPVGRPGIRPDKGIGDRPKGRPVKGGGSGKGGGKNREDRDYWDQIQGQNWNRLACTCTGSIQGDASNPNCSGTIILGSTMGHGSTYDRAHDDARAKCQKMHWLFDLQCPCGCTCRHINVKCTPRRKAPKKGRGVRIR